LTAKQQHSFLDGGIKPLRFLYALPNLNIVNQPATKKGNSDGSMGSKSKNESYEILRNPQRRSDTKVKKTKKGKRSGYNK
jgi:hypothetical protein